MAQGFGRIQLWRPYVTGAITNQGLIIRFAIGADAVCGHPFVIDADFFGGLNVVIEDHLAAARDHRAANLDWRQPVEMKVGDKVIAKVHHQISNVLDPELDMTYANS